MTSMRISRNVKCLARLLGCQTGKLFHSRHRKFELNDDIFVIQRLPSRNFHIQRCNYSKNNLSDLMKDVHEKRQNMEDVKDAGSEEKKEEEKAKPKGPKIFGKQYTWTKIGFLVFTIWASGASISLVSLWGKPQIDAEGNEIRDEFSDYPSFIAYCKRTYKEIFYQVKITAEPSREKLLPDPLKYPYIQPKYTLVLEMTDVLVHPDWTYGTGWRFKKRPGIDHFLRLVGPPLFEIVIYTKEQGMTADPIITKIDAENCIMYRLYRDATRYEDGLHIKDLSYLNRDLSKVIMVDWDELAYKLNPENGFKLKQWKGEDNDTVLGELGEFLRAIAVSNVDDVRPVLQYYKQFDDPISQFHENQKKLMEEQERQALVQKQMQKKRSSFLNLR